MKRWFLALAFFSVCTQGCNNVQSHFGPQPGDDEEAANQAKSAKTSVSAFRGEPKG